MDGTLPRAKIQVYDSEWNHLAYCSYDTPSLSIAGVKHSGDIVSAPYPDGARETCTVNFADLRNGFAKARYVVFAVFSYSRQKWDDLEDASVFVANPHARGSGPGGMAVVGAARLTGAATTSIAGYLDLVPLDKPVAPLQEEPVFGIRRKSPNIVDKDLTVPGSDNDMRIHFVFTDQEGRIGPGYHARGSKDAVGKLLSEMKESRTKSGAQTLANAAAFQAALVCDRVCIVADGVGNTATGKESGINLPASPSPSLSFGTLSRGSDEGRFAFYERIAGALDQVTPATPATEKQGGGKNYPAAALGIPTPVVNSSCGHGKDEQPNARSAVQHTVFFGGDLDDWLEVSRQHGMNMKALGNTKKVGETGGATTGGPRNTLTLVNVRSAEKGRTKPNDAGVSRVNGATAYEDLVQAVREARTADEVLGGEH